ncbi:MAG: HpcH/HpaI aldolase family protein [Planctomycetota bacterium]|jgi:4-hydroxy-2-oxoheptanedioate aldolase
MNFKEKLNSKKAVCGIFSKTNDPMIVEAVGRSGFDFIILDNEHGPNSQRELLPLIMASELCGMSPVVRVGELSQIEIQRTLDLGIAAIQIPQINSKEDALKVIEFCKYYPLGQRGVCRYVRPADYSLKDKTEYFAEQNEVAVIIHIEGKEGLESIDEIIEVDGLDVIFVGPYDLSQSLGIPGEVENPILLKEIKMISDKCKAKNKHVGIFTENVDSANKYIEMGVKYISYSVDVGILAQQCEKIVEGINS